MTVWTTGDFTQEFDVGAGIDAVIHLAARCGGIGKNQREPAWMFADNMRMGLNVLDACVRAKCRLLMVGTVCSYPGFLAPPFDPGRLWDGYPEPTNAPYGIAKRALLVAAEAYHKQHGLDVVSVIPTNLYGPGDHFDLEDSHVIPALIRKFCEAGTDGRVDLWGDGSAHREFLYVEDCARAIVAVLERGQGTMPYNLGGGGYVSIRDLAFQVATACDWSGIVRWDRDKPNGQMDRWVDWAPARALGWEPQVQLAEGLKRTVEWYRCHAH